MRQADVIIYLDLPEIVLIGRILRRFIRRKLGLEARMKKESVKGMVNLLTWNHTQIQEIKKLIDGMNDRQIIEI
jgi:hypothetical protein